MEILLRSCAEVRAAIELSLEELSGVGYGIGVVDRVYVPEGEGRFWDLASPFAPLV